MGPHHTLGPDIDVGEEEHACELLLALAHGDEVSRERGVGEEVL